MTEVAYISLSVLLAVSCLVLAVVIGVQHSGRSMRIGSMLMRRYMRTATMLLMGDFPKARTMFPMIERRGARAVLVQVLVRLASSAYGTDKELLSRIVVANGLDRWLLRRIERSSGYVRARYLSVLACLPPAADVVGRVARYEHGRNRMVRFYAMMVRVAWDPSHALKALADWPEPLAGFEISEIISMLRRGLFPVAYGPLLESNNRNLRVIGLNIVRQFGIVEAERALLKIIDSDSDCKLCYEAIYTLASMHCQITRREIVRRVWAMSHDDRKALCRRLALEGYSLMALGRFVDADGNRYVESLVSSYKRTIACN